jgi:hypothetical protein
MLAVRHLHFKIPRSSPLFLAGRIHFVLRDYLNAYQAKPVPITLLRSSESHAVTKLCFGQQILMKSPT